MKIIDRIKNSPKARQVLDLSVKFFALGWLIRNVVSAIAIIPILVKMIEEGGTLMAIWVAVSTLIGLALSIIVPTFTYRKLKRKLAKV